MSGAPRKLVVGRAKDCDILLTHESVSRRHAELTLDTGAQFAIRDLQSTGGTFVVRGGEEIPVHETALKRDDILCFGEYNIALADLLALVPPERTAPGPGPQPPPSKPRMMRCACGTIKERGKPCPDCGA